MRIRIQAVNYDLWQIVEEGYTIQQQDKLSSDDKENLQLDAQAKDIICGSLSKDIFLWFHRLNTAKQIWDALNSAYVDLVARSGPHIKVLRTMFIGFSLRKESVMELTDRLTNIVERLHQLGVTDITNRDVINKLLCALDKSFDLIVSEIKQRPDYEELHYVEVMTLLSIHEEKMELEMANQESSSEGEGEIFSHYGSSEEEEDVENQHSITRELEILTQRLSDLKRHNLYLVNDEEFHAPESSRRRLPPKDMKCFKCKLYGHVIADCPAAKRKLVTDEKAAVSVKKAKKIIPASIEEYDFDMIFDIIEEDVTKMVAKHFIDMKEITKELNQVVEYKKLLEKMGREAKSEAERKDVNKAILETTKALTTMRNNKIEWHSRMKMDVSQLCDRRIEEIQRQENLA
nr:uncharacterized protein LOC109766547 [Aegilops tauschii subsp. strangulata]